MDKDGNLILNIDPLPIDTRSAEEILHDIVESQKNFQKKLQKNRSI